MNTAIKNNHMQHKALIPLVIMVVILGIGMRIAFFAGFRYWTEDNSTSNASRTSRSSRRSSDWDRNHDMDDDNDEDVVETSEVDNSARWTVLVYMCGTDLESQTGIASIAFDWMDDEDITDEVNVIVETGGTVYWNNEDPYFNGDAVQSVDIPTDMLGRYQIKQGEIIDLGSSDLQSMGSSETLAEFISWGVEEYPADHYMFVMWNHGYAEPYGNMEHDEIFFDDGNGGTINSMTSYVDPSEYYNDCLTLDEVSEGFRDGGVHFDMIAFNTCLSASMEVASAVAPYSDYMVASEEIIPAVVGIPVEYITYLAENPDCTVEQLGNEILSLYSQYINAYTDQYSSDEEISNMFATGTMSMIDLSAMEQIDSLMGDLWERLYYSTYNPDEFASVIDIASKCENYGAEGGVPGNLIDFRSFLVGLGSIFTDTSVDDELIDLIDNNVVSISGNARSHSDGISIYFPSAVYPQAVRSSYETMLNTYDIEYTEDEMIEILHNHLTYALDGYIENIDFIDGYYWYAAFLQVRFADYWAADTDVWTLVNNTANPGYADLTQVSADNAEEIEYSVVFDDSGNITLDITSGYESVLSVEANVCLFTSTDTASAYYLIGSEPIYPESDEVSLYNYNPNCEWINVNDYDITVFLIEDTEDHTIFATPADINEVWSFIYIYYDKITGEYSPLYCAVIDPTSGVATNDIFYLEVGDTIEFMYYSLVNYDGFDPILGVRGLFDSFVYDGTLDVTRGAMYGTGNGEKITLVNFLIRDCFGNITDTFAVEIIYDDNNEIVSVSEAQNYMDYTNLYEVTAVWG